jgi:hypothetical protein
MNVNARRYLQAQLVHTVSSHSGIPAEWPGLKFSTCGLVDKQSLPVL